MKTDSVLSRCPNAHGGFPGVTAQIKKLQSPLTKFAASKSYAARSEEVLPYRQSIQIVKELMNNRMFPTTIGGLEKAMKALAK